MGKCLAPRSGPLAAEHVGVPPDQLLLDPLRGLGKRHPARILEDHQKENPEVESVADLLPEFGGIAAREGIEDLVGLLDEEWRETFRGLRAVPGAAVRPLEYIANVDQASPYIASIRFARCHGRTITRTGEGVLQR
jgi:hypothetical protein